MEKVKFIPKSPSELSNDLSKYKKELEQINLSLDLKRIDSADMEYIEANQDKIKRGSILGALIRTVENQLKQNP